MIVLDSTSKIVVFLAGSITTNQLEFVASYADKTTTAVTPGRASGATNNTTATDLVTAPAASTQRMIKKIVVHNKDTAAATITIEEDISAARKRVCRITLATLDTLEIDDEIRVTDSNGNLKETTGFGTQTANYVFAGPSSGSPATPSFRAIVLADLNLSATDKLLGRSTAGAGVAEEIACTAAARSILDDASVGAIRTTLGVGTGDTPTFVGINLGDENLNDYDEGSFVPDIRGTGGSAGSYAASVKVGTYVRIGTAVFFRLYIVLTDKGSWSGDAIINGLPFTSEATAGSLSAINVGLVSTITLSASKYTIGGYISTSATTIILTEAQSAAAASTLPYANIAATSQIVVSGWYKV